MRKGDVVLHYDNERTGILLNKIQEAWGAKRFRILWDNGEVTDIWDKHVRVICGNRD